MTPGGADPVPAAAPAHAPMAAHLIDGKGIAGAIRDQVRKEVAGLGFVPCIAVVLAGDDPASHLYVRLKERACAEAGIRLEKFLFDADAAEAAVIETVAQLGRRDDVDAILVQLPLPAQLDEARVIGAIPPEKDVDGFHPDTVARYLKDDAAVPPVLVAAIMTLVRSTKSAFDGRRAAILANSETFCRPMAKALADEGAVPEALDADDPGLAVSLRREDLVIVALGRPHFLRAGMFKPGAVAIDVGTTRVGDKVRGDIDPAAAETLSYLTPVPGGVGPVTVAMLLRNAVALARRRRG